MLNRLVPCAVVVALAGAAGPYALAQTASDGVAVDSVVLRLIHEADAPAQEAGVVAEIAVREGDVVSKGDLLAQIDDAKSRLAVRSAELQLAIASAKARNDVQVRFAAKAREVAAAELRRSEESISAFPKSVSESQLDVERLTLQRTTLEEEQAQHEQELERLEMELRGAELAAARLDNKRRQITAPLDGVVVEVAAKLGEWLEPGQQAFRLVNTDRLKAEGFVSAAEAARPLRGARVRLTVPDDPREYTGRVEFVSPEIDPINNQVRVWAEVDNPHGALRPGQHAQMTIVPDPEEKLAEKP